MQTVRVSPTEVQFNAMVYTFSRADEADLFLASALLGNEEAYSYGRTAIRRRPIDCDHETGDFAE
jgi:hypothetical protein